MNAQLEGKVSMMEFQSNNTGAHINITVVTAKNYSGI